MHFPYPLKRQQAVISCLDSKFNSSLKKDIALWLDFNECFYLIVELRSCYSIINFLNIQPTLLCHDLKNGCNIKLIKADLVWETFLQQKKHFLQQKLLMVHGLYCDPLINFKKYSWTLHQLEDFVAQFSVKVSERALLCKSKSSYVPLFFKTFCLWSKKHCGSNVKRNWLM